MKSREERYYFYVGSYTDAGQMGLFLFSFDVLTQKIEKIGQYKNGIDCPAYLISHPEHKIIYSAGDAVSNGIGIYRANQETRALEFIGRKETAGNYTCHIAFNQDCSLLFAMNYGGGSVSVFSLEGEEAVKKADYFLEDSSVNPTRQTEAHAHFGVVTPDGAWLCIMNLGGDTMEMFRIEGKSLIAAPEKKVIFKKGYGPRHLLFHPNGKFAYATCEMASEVAVLEYNNSEHLFQIVQYIKSTKGNAPNLDSALCLSRDGRYLYVCNRGEDTIAVFAVDSDNGTLCKKYIVDAGGRWPREMSLDPCGQFLFVMNQLSDVITIFHIDESGKPVFCTEYKGVVQPACILFV